MKKYMVRVLYEGLGGALNNRTGPYCFPDILTHIDLHGKYGSNLIRTFRVKNFE